MGADCRRTAEGQGSRFTPYVWTAGRKKLPWVNLRSDKPGRPERSLSRYRPPGNSCMPTEIVTQPVLMDSQRFINPLARAQAGGARAVPAGDSVSSDDEVDASASTRRRRAGRVGSQSDATGLARSSFSAHAPRRAAASQVSALRAFYAAQRYASQVSQRSREGTRELSGRGTAAQQAREISRQQRVIEQFRSERCVDPAALLRTGAPA